MKFKRLTEKQIIISIDRLTRFKPTEEKYLRVFKDIILSNLIEPRLKKTELETLDYKEIRDIASEIFNSSLNEDNTDDLSVNCRLKEYENSIFYNSDEINSLLENRLDYKSAIKLLKDPLPVNLMWLKELLNDADITKMREKKGLQFPVSAAVIVEGITEEILLPEFSEILGFDFMKYGIKILPAGGKNQVVKLYYSLSEELRIPIFILLDKDAYDNVESINKKLRACDTVYLLNSGEFEDLLPKHLIVRTINSHLKNFDSINADDITTNEPMVKVLEEIFKLRGIHEFKKAEFAHLMKNQIESEDDVSDEIRCIVEGIKKLSYTKSLI